MTVVNNDLLRVGPGAHHVVVENNMFYNQAGSDEHIDINGAFDVVVQDNIFFNDFAGSGRTDSQSTSSYIVIKDSVGNNGGSQEISIRRNIFLNWEGKRKHFVLVGEDGISTFEAVGVMIENNLMLGNGPDPLYSPIGIRGSKDITVRANTIVGDQPGWYFGLVSYIVEANPRNENVAIYNNIWSDPTGTMGEGFSCCDPAQTRSYAFDNNLFFNNGKPFPTSSDSFVEISDDLHRVIGDPKLGDQRRGITVPRWNGTNFNGGYDTIQAAFRGLVEQYGLLGGGSAAFDKANPAYMPAEDILGRDRSKIDSRPDIGDYERQ